MPCLRRWTSARSNFNPVRSHGTTTTSGWVIKIWRSFPFMMLSLLAAVPLLREVRRRRGAEAGR